MTQVFISYSRKDAAFARKLTDSLEKSEMELWIDWYNIPPTADWMRQIEKGIEGAQGFLFLLSPDSVKSGVCAQEIDHAAKNGKRLIPVVVRDVDPQEVHPALAKLNWIFLREADDFDASLQKLLTAIKTDLAWVEAHRDLQVKALEWDENKDASLLLRGRELKESEEQLAEAGTKDPQPTDLQRRFVLESRKRETRTRNITVTISAAAMVVLAIASVIAIIQGNNATRQAQIAEEQTQIALSRQLAAQASSQMNGNYDLSALLSVEAFNHADTIEARSILLRGLQQHPKLLVYLHGHDSPIAALVFNPRNNILVSADKSRKIMLWDADNRKIIRDGISVNEPLTSLHFSPDGLTLTAETQTENGLQWTLWKISDLEHPVTTTDMPAWCETECPKNIYFPSPYQVVAASNPDGKMQVEGGTDKTVTFWDVSSNPPVRISALMQGHSNFVNRVAWSSDGKIVASGDEDGNILLWSPPVFAPLPVSTETPAKGVDVSFYDGDVDWEKAKADGVAFAFVRRGQGINQLDKMFETNWDLLSKAGIPRSTYHYFLGASDAKEQAVFFASQVPFQPGDLPPVLDFEDIMNEDFLKLGNENVIISLETWLTELERQTGRRPIIYSRAMLLQEYLRDRTGQYPEWLASYPLWIANYFYDMQSVEDTRGRQPTMPKGWPSEWSFWQFTDQAQVNGTTNKTIDLNAFNGSTQDLITALQTTPFPARIMGNPARDMNGLLIAQTFEGEPGAVSSVAISPDGKLLASGSADGRLMLWDMENDQKLATLKEKGNFIYSVAFSPDGTQLAAGSGDATMTLWDIKKKSVASTFSGHGGRVTGVAFNPDGSILAAGSCAKKETSGLCSLGEIALWNLEKNEKQELTAHTDTVNTVAFSPNGKWFASGGEDGKIILWDTKTWQTVEEPLTEHKSSVLNLAFSHNSKYLASASQDKSIILWDMSTREIAGQPLRGHTRAVFGLSFSPDDRLLASGSWDKTIILWDVNTHEPVGDPLRGHTDYVYSLAFTPNGDWLISGSWDNTIIKWDMRLETWESLACGLANRNFTQQEWNTYFPGVQLHQTCPPSPG